MLAIPGPCAGFRDTEQLHGHELAAPGGWRLRMHDQAWHYLLGLGPDIALVQEALPPTWVRRAGAASIHGPTEKFGSFISAPGIRWNA